MITAFQQIPAPLKKQTLIRLGFAVLFLVLMIPLLFFARDIYIMLPCVGALVFFTASAFVLFRKSVLRDYVIINGVCQSIENTPVRRRARYIILRSGEQTLKVALRNRVKGASIGADVDLYAANEAPIYEKDGVQILYSYLAIDFKQNGRQANFVQRG